MIVREFDREKDLDGLRACLIELQDFERAIDPRKPAGGVIADPYVSDALSRCAEHHGKILVAEERDEILGYVTVLARVRADWPDDGDLEYAYLADLIVREEYRGRGIGSMLMVEAEAYARDAGAKWLRVSVLAGNNVARRLYETSGFSELAVDLEKGLTVGAGDE